jgi:hypothetical protein
MYLPSPRALGPGLSWADCTLQGVGGELHNSVSPISSCPLRSLSVAPLHATLILFPELTK